MTRLTQARRGGEAALFAIRWGVFDTSRAASASSCRRTTRVDPRFCRVHERADEDRHCSAELALRSGVRLDVVSRQLGHVSIATTANVYTQDGADAAMDAATKAACALRGILGE